MRLDQILNSAQTPGKWTIQVLSEAEGYAEGLSEVSHLKQAYCQHGIRPAMALSSFIANPTAKPSTSPSPQKK